MPAAINWTPELVTSIVVDIESGRSVASICGSNTFPHDESTFWRHFSQDTDFASVIARAMETRTDRDVDHCRDIAQRSTVETWQRDQFEVRTLQWEAGKRRPKKYGDKQLHTGADGEGPVVVKVDM